MKINGLELPIALEINLLSGHYKLSSHQTTRLKAALTQINNPDPKFYRIQGIERENKLWEKPHAKYYLGTPNVQYLPGDIDPKRTLIIGHAEPDSAIALDYRHKEPSIIYFCDIHDVNYWVDLCPSYAALLKIMGDG